jgi:hypothetical protein
VEQAFPSLRQYFPKKRSGFRPKYLGGSPQPKNTKGALSSAPSQSIAFFFTL